MTNPIDEQIERLRAAVALFFNTYGRVPTVAFDADGVIYDFETTFIAHHNRTNPQLPPVIGPFVNWDLGHERTQEIADALDASMQTIDWSDLKAYPAALAVIPVLVEVGLDLSVATAHRVDNLYSPAAKVFQFHRDFDGYFDNRIQIGIDKTRVVADFLVDDKPEVKGQLVPLWQHLRFTQIYNRDLPGIHVVWETMFEVLASAIEAKLAGRELTPVPAPTGETGSTAVTLVADPPEAAAPSTAIDGDAPLAPVNDVVPALTLPWEDDEPQLVPVDTSDDSWELVEKGASK